MDITVLKQANQKIKESVALKFRKEAMSGGDGLEMVEELEVKLRGLMA